MESREYPLTCFCKITDAIDIDGKERNEKRVHTNDISTHLFQRDDTYADLVGPAVDTEDGRGEGDGGRELLGHAAVNEFSEGHVDGVI